MDSKAQLVSFAQQYCRRPITANDVVYKVTQFGEQHQAIVELACLNGAKYASNLCTDPRDAELSAASIALEASTALMPEQAVAPAISQAPQANSWGQQEAGAWGPPAKKHRTVAPPQNAPGAGSAGVAAGSIAPKVKLNSLLVKITGKASTIFDCKKVAGGFQATVKCPCLPRGWNDRAWAGYVCPDTLQAEQSAAEIAVGQIEGDAEMQSLAAFAGSKGSSKGGSKGGGWNDDGWAAAAAGGGCGKAGAWGNAGKSGGQGWGAVAPASAAPKSWAPQWGGADQCWAGGEEEWDENAMWAMMSEAAAAWGMAEEDMVQEMAAYASGNWGGGGDWGHRGRGGGGGGGGKWKKDKADGPNLERSRVLEDLIAGTCVNWPAGKNFGWVKSDIPLDHPMAKKRQGHLYVHEKDLTGDLKTLKADAPCTFYVYEDSSGLGAEEVTQAVS